MSKVTNLRSGRKENNMAKKKKAKQDSIACLVVRR
jgi:hypothetical protein